MAVPAEMTILNLSGKFIMNKPLCDPHDEIFRLQGMGWLKRKAISIATITLKVNHLTDADGLENVNVDQTLTGGIPASSERRPLDWTERQIADPNFGHVVEKMRRIRLDELENEFLKKGWEQDTQENGVLHLWIKSDTPKSGTTWYGDQVWGIEEINGERRYTRHVHFIGPKEEMIDARIVFDYVGSL
ncbi:hypothetical protein VKT23_010382 [Stygiomarasmius scandens]|uniref:Uncharacterized protein n=1 Tax=Marasmiellus scandens TaxID=2682957 RepID=A0ABR1JBI8_9AGAR